VLLKESGSHQSAKFRGIELAGAALLGLFSIVMTVSIAGALFNGSGVLFSLGSFFVDSLGILSFGIPGYLFCAAFLLGSPHYRPDRIFILSCSLLPFVTLAMGFVFIRDFDYWSERFDVFYWAGKGGFNLFVILLTIIEGLIIAAFTALLFPPNQNPGNDPPREETDIFKTGPPDIKPFWKLTKRKPGLFLPDARKRSSAGRVSEELWVAEPSAEGIDIEGIRLPDIKPLSSVSAMHKLESIVYYTPERGAEAEEVYPGSGNYRNGGIDVVIEPVDEPQRRRDPAKTLRAEEPDDPAEPPVSWKVYQIPVRGLLSRYSADTEGEADQTVRDAAVILKETLREFNIQAEIADIRKCPSLTVFEVLPAPGVKFSKIINLQDNIALRLSAPSIRIPPPVSGKQTVSIEVPTVKRTIVPFAEIIAEELRKEGKKPIIPVMLGKDLHGEVRFADLVLLPHLLIAGVAGSGKSVFLNALLLSIMYQRSPGECRFLMIDPNLPDLKRYNDIPHLLTPVITEPKRAFQALQYCIFEMERRYACLDSLEVRDIRSYNRRIKERGIGVEPLPYIVVIINELAEVMDAGKEFESALARLAAMSRAVGIHLVLTTRRSSIDVITGLIKANIPSRIAFMVGSKLDSRIVLDAPGAEKLLGKGDMLYAEAGEPVPVRIQGPYISDEEIERVTEYVKAFGYPDYIDDELFIDEEINVSFAEADPLYERAVEIVMEEGKASSGSLQRRLKIGYNRAVRLIDEMEQRGLVSPSEEK
jgi:S-DNA-T family DNA segregation ATPase FtsK/SpoIIIE